MNKPVYITLPVADLAKSTAFFTALGFSFDPKFAGEHSACVILNETTFAMLAPHDKFRELTPRAVCDTARFAEMLLCLTCDTRADVDALVAKAIAAGGTADKPEEFGFMYTHGFTDPDGHGWGLACMTPTDASLPGLGVEL